MKHKIIAQEYPLPREEFYTNDIISLLKKTLLKDYATYKMHRRFHAKSHGLLKADLTVAQTIPDELKIGLFKTRKTYQAWIRFSNGAQNVTADYKKSVRGMSIKVLNTGEASIEDDKLGQTQDMLLTNNKIIFPGSVKLQGTALRVLFVSKLYVIPILLSGKLRGMLRFIKGRIKTSNVLEQEYFSGTPYLFGNGKAIKWQASPLKAANSLMPENPDEGFLRNQLADDLSKSEFSFELFAQFQQDAKKDPIEDSAVEWTTSCCIKMATITILKQDFNSKERKELDESITFNPWYSMPDHRPLGGINRVRRRIYRELSAFRQLHNTVVK